MKNGSPLTKRASGRSRKKVANAASSSRLVLARRTWIWRPMARAAAAHRLPIVFADGEDPVKLGRQPDRDQFFIGELAAKRLELVRELKLGATRVAVLVNPGPCHCRNQPERRRTLQRPDCVAEVVGLEVRRETGKE